MLFERNVGEFKQRRRRLQRVRQKKQVGLDWQNNNFAVTARLRRKMPNLTFGGGREHKTMTFFFFPELRYSLLEIKLQKKLPTFEEVNEMARDKVRSTATSLLSDVFVAVAVVVA